MRSVVADPELWQAFSDLMQSFISQAPSRLVVFRDDHKDRVIELYSPRSGYDVKLIYERESRYGNIIWIGLRGSKDQRVSVWLYKEYTIRFTTAMERFSAPESVLSLLQEVYAAFLVFIRSAKTVGGNRAEALERRTKKVVDRALGGSSQNADGEAEVVHPDTAKGRKITLFRGIRGDTTAYIVEVVAETTECKGSADLMVVSGFPLCFTSLLDAFRSPEQLLDYVAKAVARP